MSENEALYEKAMNAITELFNDKSVDTDQTRANLEELVGEINIMLEALEGED